MQDDVAFRVTVEPLDPAEQRWQWTVTILLDGRPNILAWSEGGSWRRPAPWRLRGRTKSEHDANIDARQVVADGHAVLAEAAHLRARTSSQRID
ncbi:MAG: hypothetical protein ACXIVQ_12155 [Acidimicrobiales bacterium]